MQLQWLLEDVAVNEIDWNLDAYPGWDRDHEIPAVALFAADQTAIGSLMASINPCPNIATTALGRVAFCTTKPIVMEYARVFRDGNREERLCVVVDMAATIFHEFRHVCLLNTDDANPRGCETSYLAENTFKWLLLRRYPGALSAGCCGSRYASRTDPSLPDPTLFMQDSSTTMAVGGVCAQ